LGRSPGRRKKKYRKKKPLGCDWLRKGGKWPRNRAGEGSVESESTGRGLYKGLNSKRGLKSVRGIKLRT